jgi:hypothetical protein
MTRARQTVPGNAYALQAARGVCCAYWAAPILGRDGLARRDASRAEARHDSCFGPVQACLLSCQVVLVPGQTLRASCQPINRGPNF